MSKLMGAKRTETPQSIVVPVQRDSCPAPPVAPPGITAAQDPKFQQVKQDVARKGKTAKAHPNAQSEVGEAQAAAEPPADDREAQAKAAHTAEMAQAKPAGFDKAAFIAAVTEAIAAQRPQTNEEATEFASSGKAGEIKNQVSGMVTAGKDKSGKEIADSSAKPPDPGVAVEKPVTPMAPPKPTPDIKPPDGRKAVPDKAPAEQTELGSTKCELNEKMAGSGVTEQQLANSNEPDFTKAVDAKGKAEEHAATAPAQMRAEEQAQLAGNVAGAQAAGAAGVTGMVGDNARAMGRAGTNKNAAKTRDERERARISGEIKRIFDTTKTEVDGILGGIDAKVDTLFTAGEAKARAVFEADHRRRMQEYEDAQDLVTWIADKFRPTRPEVLQIFTDAAKTYEREMQKVISGIADVIGAELDKATARIQLGRDQVARFVAEQPRELQSIARETAGEMGDQFASLDASVTEKSQSLAEDLASKYAEARAGVDARVQELQAEHRSWRDQAVDAIEGAIDTITKLKDMLLGVLARAAGAIDKIIADPIGFLGNLVTAVKNGVMAFGANIATHLQAGLKAWLLGSLASAGIEIPEEFDVKGILKMVLSILGLTWPAIRARIVRFIPEPVMARLEQMVEVVQILVTEGVPGLWRWIVEKLGDLKEMVLGQIKEFVVSKIIQAGIVWIISMLNPAAAFIKACQAIYNIVMFFVNQASQIKEFVDAVLDGIDSIASGGGGAVSALIEGALAKALPMVIGFMASLLGLGGISEKIRGILQKVQEPVGKVIDKVIGTIVKIGKGLLAKLRRAGRRNERGDTEALSPAQAEKVKHDAIGTATGRLNGVQKIEDIKPILDDVRRTYRPQGLKTLTATASPDMSTVSITATASPPEEARIPFGTVFSKMSKEKVEELRLLFENRARETDNFDDKRNYVIAAVTIDGEVIGQPEFNDADTGTHAEVMLEPHWQAAEQRLIAMIQQNRAKQARGEAFERPKLVFALSASPCQKCAPVLANRMRALRSNPAIGRDADTTLAIRAVYEGKMDPKKKTLYKDMLELADLGWDLKQLATKENFDKNWEGQIVQLAATTAARVAKAGK
ncbi:MAG TPA: hypothetical protein VGE61_08975 [Glycomyces sp.]